jgi:hypothetical protein
MDSTYLMVLAISILPTLAVGKLIATEHEYRTTDKEGDWIYRADYLLGFTYAFYIPCLLLAGVSFFKGDGFMLTLIAIPPITHLSLFSLRFLLSKKH